MAAQLAEFYKQVTAEYGVAGRVKLAMLTRIPSEKAGAEPDSAESVKLFQQAIAQIRQGRAA